MQTTRLHAASIRHTEIGILCPFSKLNMSGRRSPPTEAHIVSDTHLLALLICVCSSSNILWSSSGPHSTPMSRTSSPVGRVLARATQMSLSQRIPKSIQYDRESSTERATSSASSATLSLLVAHTRGTMSILPLLPLPELVLTREVCQPQGAQNDPCQR